MEELKSCPCCNGRADCDGREFANGKHLYYVFCEDCGLEITRAYKQEAFRDWNRRIE